MRKYTIIEYEKIYSFLSEYFLLYKPPQSVTNFGHV